MSFLQQSMACHREPPAAAPSGRLLGFAGWRSQAAATRAHTLLELLALLGRHPLPALLHSPLKLGAMTAAATKASEQNPAQGQQSETLPEGNLPPSEQRRQRSEERRVGKECR